MKNADSYITIGKLGSSYGVKGWLKVHAYTEFGASILDYKPWYLSSGKDNTWQAIEIEDGRVHGNIVIAKLAEIHNPEDARLLTGKFIAIRRSQLPTLHKDEYYWSDLQGLKVIDQHGENIGIVSYLMATGSNDVLVIKGIKEQAIPYLPGTVITKVDLENGEIIVNWEPI